MIFIDTNVPMYLVGADHPHKTHARVIVERLAAAGERLVTDAAVFQEILHRYVAIDRRDAIQPAFDLLTAIVDEVFTIDHGVVDVAKTIVLGYLKLSARDAIHAAAMHQHQVSRIVSFDSGFDQMPGLTRLSV